MLSAETASGNYPIEAVCNDCPDHSGSRSQYPGISPPEFHSGTLKLAESVAELVGHASRELHMS